MLLQTTITLAEVAPKLLRPQLDTIMQLCIKVSPAPATSQSGGTEGGGGFEWVTGRWRFSGDS